jgi:DNA-binding NarL/FixJ family response regulator
VIGDPIKHVRQTVADQRESPTTPIRVVVVDDHAMFAESVARALELADDIEVAAVARTCAEGVVAAATHAPNVAVVDYQLPDGDGVGLATRIRDVSPDTQVLLLTGLADSKVMVAAVEAGCAGFLTKDEAVGELVRAVRKVHAGEPHIPPAMLAELLPRLRPTFRRVGSQLTAREREVLQLLADGRSNETIAGQLVLSRHTVRNHVQSVLTKLDAHSKLEAVAIAVREGLVNR